jgi:hypothetical protein
MVLDYSKAYAIKDDAARNGYSRIVIFYKFKARNKRYGRSLVTRMSPAHGRNFSGRLSGFRVTVFVRA